MADYRAKRAATTTARLTSKGREMFNLVLANRARRGLSTCHAAIATEAVERGLTAMVREELGLVSSDAA